jgi:hypothetical protein
MAWSSISMDFIEGFLNQDQENVIMVLVDILTKHAHFLAPSHPYTSRMVAQLFMDIAFKLHGPLVAIITDRDIIFTSKP